MNYNNPVVGVLCLIWCAVLAAEFLYRRFGYAELARKFLHIIGGLSFAYLLQNTSPMATGVVGCILFWGMIIGRKYNICQLLDKKISRWYGELYFMLWMMFIFVVNFFHPFFSLPMIGIVVFADGLAPFGKHIISHKIYHHKTLWGALVFFSITLGILITFIWYSWHLFFMAFILTLAELFSHKGLDNIVLPGVTFLLLLLL